jgi:hypothetical protein
MVQRASFVHAASIVGIVACGYPPLETQGYVVGKVSVPTTTTEAGQFALDLGSKTSSTPDSVVDNAIAVMLAVLKVFRLDVQETTDIAVDHGSVLLLIDFHTQDFTASKVAGFEVELGANPVPMPCNGAGDTVCRHHLDGMGKFMVATSSPTDAVVTGEISSGVFKGGPGDLTLQIAFGDTNAVTLNLLHARVEAQSINDSGLTAIVGGLVTVDELKNRIGPAIQSSVQSVVDRDCTGPRVPNGCGCPGGTMGDGWFRVDIDTNRDCMISTQEILNFPALVTALQPDSCSMDSCMDPDSLSIGIKLDAVKASFR